MIAHTRTWAIVIDRLHILGFEADFAPDNLVIDILSIVNSAVAFTLNGGVMNKNIVPMLGCTKAVARDGDGPMNFS